MTIFDIETGPLPDDELREWFDFVPPEHLGEFDSATVKVGNLGPAKAADKIAQAAEDHRLACQRYDQDCAFAKADAWDAFKAKAALSPMTGRVLAIGYQDSLNRFGYDSNSYENEQLELFWNTLDRLVGWNIHNFDLPFLIRRSWKLGVKVPSNVLNGRYWNDRFIDLQQRFAAGVWKDNVSLDDAAKFLGVGRKNGHGADFARLWFGTPEERQQAIDYLRNDLALTAAIAERLGVS